MSRYCVDTSAYSHFKLGDVDVVDILDSAEWIGVSTVVLGELWTGFLQGRSVKKNEGELREFLANPVVEVLKVDQDVARAYAEIVVDLRKLVGDFLNRKTERRFYSYCVQRSIAPEAAAPR